MLSLKDLEIGDSVALDNELDCRGKVVKKFPSTNRVSVDWIGQDEISTVDVNELAKVDSVLEEEFKNAYLSNVDVMRSKLDTAKSLIDEVVDICDKNNICIDFDFGRVCAYFGKGFPSKYGTLQPIIVEELTTCTPPWHKSWGWVTSSDYC